MDIVVGVALLFVIVGLGWYSITIYNGLVQCRNDIDKAWSNIDVMLKQRHDELTNLVEVCKGYIKFEQDTLVKIAQARSQYAQAVTVGQKAQADKSVTTAMQGIFAVAENYPQLKASNNFMQLQARITALEDRIADRREFYNDSVNAYNVRMQQMPDTLMASMMRLTPRPMFKAAESDRAPLAMDFTAARGS
jgi:LemA protein